MKHWLFAIILTILLPSLVFWMFPGVMQLAAMICLIVCMLFMMVIVAGHFMLCFEDKEYAQKNKDQ
jgi:hypothetical protein